MLWKRRQQLCIHLPDHTLTYKQMLFTDNRKIPNYITTYVLVHVYTMECVCWCKVLGVLSDAIVINSCIPWQPIKCTKALACTLTDPSHSFTTVSHSTIFSSSLAITQFYNITNKNIINDNSRLFLVLSRQESHIEASLRAIK